MIKIDNFSLEELTAFAESFGEKPFRGKQLYKWMFSKWIFDFDQMTDISKSFRQILKDKCTFTPITIKTYQVSKLDGSTKFLFELEDGHFIESVILVDKDRYTACISSQVGCRMGCTFCSTAKIGLIRNLTSAEIVKQIIALNIFLDEQLDKQLTNLVFMGMGEPFDNFENIIKAIPILLDDNTLNFSHRKITVSTSGLIPEMVELTKLEHTPNIAISLNAVDDITRSKIMPVNNKYPIQNIIDTVRTLAIDKRKRLTIEYVLLKGVNDSLDDAKKLVKLLKNLPVKVNLIAYNSTDNDSISAPSREHILKFQNVLVESGFSCFLRKSLGSDIDGACGQLYALNSNQQKVSNGKNE